MHNIKLSTKAGRIQNFTLIEIAIAIAVFAIGILTALGILVPTVRWGADAKSDFTAAEAAVSLIEQIETNGGTAAIFGGADGAYPYVAVLTASNNAADYTVVQPVAKNQYYIKVFRKLPTVNYGYAADSSAAESRYQNVPSVSNATVVSRRNQAKIEFIVPYYAPPEITAPAP